MEERKTIYLVTYEFMHSLGNGFGNIYVHVFGERKKDQAFYESLRETARDGLLREYAGVQVVILNVMQVEAD